MNFFFQRQLMTFARKGFLAMCFCRFAPGIQGTVGNAQFSCDLRFRFVTGLGQLNRFLLELSRKTWLWFWHRDLLFKTGLSTFYHSTIPGEDHQTVAPVFHQRVRSDRPGAPALFPLSSCGLLPLLQS